VRLALARGLPVLWIDAAGACQRRWLDPALLWEDGGFHELTRALETQRDATAPALADDTLAAKLAAHIASRLAAPEARAIHAEDDGHGERHDLSEDAARRDFEAAEAELAATPGKPLGNRIGWRRRIAGTWFFFRDIFAWERPTTAQLASRPELIQPPAGLAFIRKAMARAEDVANVYGNLHRTLQVWLMIVAVAAVLVGTAAAVAPGLKWIFVVAELGLALLALFVWRLRLVASNHQRWSDSRRYAERLRVMAATWPLGFDVADDRADAPSTWTEWRARAVLRLAGPPTGALKAENLRAAALESRDDHAGIVRGQLLYHRTTEIRMGRAHRHTHNAETWAFYGLVAALLAFALAYHLFPKQPAPHWPPDPGFWPNRLGGLLLILSAVIPAFAAAIIALEAKIGFRENELRSSRLRPEFERLLRDMGGVMPGEPGPAGAPSMFALAESLRAAGKLHLADADSWRDGVTRRQIVKL
jgi:hypothetical protein